MSGHMRIVMMMMTGPLVLCHEGTFAAPLNQSSLSPNFAYFRALLQIVLVTDELFCPAHTVS